jgi:hypothetical protein
VAPSLHFHPVIIIESRLQQREQIVIGRAEKNALLLLYIQRLQGKVILIHKSYEALSADETLPGDGISLARDHPLIKLP